jgi:ATP-binding cassette, subfamily B, multidrug efflux pump
MSDAYFQEEALGKAYDSRLMKRLLKYLRPYRLHTVAGAISLILIGALQVYLIVLVQRAIDDYVNVGDLSGLHSIAWLYLGAMAFHFGLEYFQIIITTRMGQEVQQDIRLQVFRKLQGMELKFFDRNPVGRLVTRVTNDVNVLNELFSSGVINIIGDLILLTGYVSLMLYYNWQLSIAIFLILPALGVATIIFRRKVREVYRRLRITVAQINAYLSERLSGIAIIKLFSQEDATYAGFEERNRTALEQNLKQVFYYAVFFPIVNLIGAISLAALIVYGGMQIEDGLLTFGELTAFILLVERFYRPIRDLSEKYNVLQASMASSERIFQLLDTESDQTGEASVVAVATPDSVGTPANRREPTIRGAITFENVTFAYNPPENVITDVSFKVEPGESIALVGATGSGKTTLVSLLFRFYEPQNGRILLDGRDIRELSVPELRSHLGLVMQDVQIFSGTIADNVRLGEKDIDDERIRWALREVGFDRAFRSANNAAGKAEIKEALDISKEIKERGATLSTGQKQLLSFARALAFDPKILALDEATSSIDTSTERLIQQALDKIMQGRTSLVVAHRLSTIERADNILVMHHGRLCEQGSHSELLAAEGIYHKLYQMQYQRSAVEVRA